MENNTALQNKIYLLVPFEKKDSVKKLGAKWDPENKGWYIDQGRAREPFINWLPEMYKPDTHSPYLTCNPIPSENWGKNMRTLFMEEEWQKLRTLITKSTGNRCNICGKHSKGRHVDCHEDWDFYLNHIDNTGVQVLKQVIALCDNCHAAVHIGRTLVKGQDYIAIEQLKFVNDWTEDQAKHHIDSTMLQWQEMNQYNWSLDILSILYIYQGNVGYFPKLNRQTFLELDNGNELLKDYNLLFETQADNKNQPQNQLFPPQRKKLLIGLLALILGTYVYFSLSRPPEGLQSASLPLKTAQPVRLDNPPAPQKSTDKPKSTQEKSKSQYRKCEPVRGQPGAKMCQDHNGQWHLIRP